MAVLGTLKEAREILNNGWTQQEYARDQYGKWVSFDSPSASCYCIYGALAKAANESVIGDTSQRAASVLLDTLRDDGFHQSIVTFNDSEGRTQEEVLSLFDRTIERISQ